MKSASFLLSTAFGLIACSAPSQGRSSDGGALPSGTAGSGGAPGAGGGASQAGSPAGGTTGGASQAGSPAGGATGGSTGGAMPDVYPPGPPGCGLEAAAFCDSFDAPAGANTRAGELDPVKWSAARFCNIGGPSDFDEAVAIGPATVPACRADLTGQLLPSHDAVICDPTDFVQSNHLLVLAAAQNYGQNSYRIRQPFDFADRTGSIVFDVEGHLIGLQGWVSIEITEDPAPAPSFTLQQNYENGSIPRNGIEIQFAQPCFGDNVGISHLFSFNDFHQDVVISDTAVCVPAAAGHLNHFEVKLSQSHVQVFGKPASDDGVTFGEAVLLGEADLNLPFSRGFVHLTTHNHASLKYSENTVDAWTARWDNVGFDGPAITGGWREYEALDALSVTQNAKMNVGWRLAAEASGPAQQITIDGVDLNGVSAARLALQNWSYHTVGDSLGEYSLNYRLNGHAWKHRPLTDSEIAMMTELPNAGTRSIMLDVDIADLVNGTNTVEFTTTNALPPLIPVILNIDLVLDTH